MSPAATDGDDVTPVETAPPQTRVTLAGKITAGMCIVTPATSWKPRILPEVLIRHGDGCGPGFGLGIAECCLDDGAATVCSTDLAAPGDDLAALEKKHPGRRKALAAYVTREASVTAAISQIVDESGAVHGMVVSAGRTNHRSALDSTEEDVHALSAVNVTEQNP